MFIHSSIPGHRGCFQVLIVNNGCHDHGYTKVSSWLHVGFFWVDARKQMGVTLYFCFSLLSDSYVLSLYVWMLCHVYGDQRTAFGSHCSPSFHHLIPGIELGSSGLAASALTPCALSAALCFNFLKNCHTALPGGCTRLCPYNSTQGSSFSAFWS